ncbi:chitin synthase-domain-containing protein [Endogone sp. FLAS-F59071]|nr:chitin synthase-domain-containing protein [Endogone sp. FLAS-F59071]|eukprot:RUS21261.1 chitin synthase-domain-containing protein [Endogone sp. FLAS-F59071]
MSSARRRQVGNGVPEMARNPASSTPSLVPQQGFGLTGLRQNTTAASAFDDSWDDDDGAPSTSTTRHEHDVSNIASFTTRNRRPGNPSSPVLTPRDSSPKDRQPVRNGSENSPPYSTQSSASSSARTDTTFSTRIHFPLNPRTRSANTRGGINADALLPMENPMTPPESAIIATSYMHRRRAADSISSTRSNRSAYNDFESTRGLISPEQRAAAAESATEARLASAIDQSDSRIGVAEQLQQGMSWERKAWVAFSRACTLLVPDFALQICGRIKDKDARQTWREKFTICILIAAVYVLVVLWLEVFAQLFCSPQSSYYYTDIVKVNATSPMVVVNGKAIDLSRQASSDVAAVVNRYPGKDLSTLFPTYTLLARHLNNYTYGEPTIERCVAEQEVVADRWLHYRLINDTGVQINKRILTLCPDPNNRNRPGPPCFYNTSAINELKQGIRGDIVFTRDYVASCTSISECAFVIINSRVYDVTDYLNSVSSLLQSNQAGVSRKLYLNRMFLPLPLTEILLLNLGQDITSYYYGNVTEEPELYVQCMDRLFYRGIVEDAIPNACANYNPVLWASLAVGLFTFLLKINFARLAQMSLLAHFLPFTRRLNSLAPPPNIGHVPYCILMVPCCAEPSNILQETIESLARSTYDDTRRLLVFVCDGMVKSSGDALETHQEVLKILGYSGTDDPTPYAYNSLGLNAKRTNFARVYAGFYESREHRVPYIVIVKVGNRLEVGCPIPGNRGKRDSILMVFAFLERCMDLTTRRIVPFEHELYRQILDVPGIDPRRFKYCMVIDADTRVDVDATRKMIEKMERNEDLLAVSGNIRPRDYDNNNITAMLQLFHIYLTYNATAAAEACLGGVVSMAGGFAMYRIWFGVGGEACCVHQTVLKTFGTPQPDTLHMKNLLLMGEDQYLSTALLRSHPRLRIGFEPDAIAWVRIPTSLATLHGQQRRVIASEFHNLVELCKVGRHFGVGIRLLAVGKLGCMVLIPIAVLYMYSAFMRFFILGWPSYLVVVASIAVVLLLHILYFLVQLQLKNIFLLLLHCFAAVPLFYVWFPLMALWRADECDYWYDVWPTTDKGTAKRLHGILDDTGGTTTTTPITEPSGALAETASRRMLLRDYEAAEQNPNGTVNIGEIDLPLPHVLLPIDPSTDTTDSAAITPSMTQLDTPGTHTIVPISQIINGSGSGSELNSLPSTLSSSKIDDLLPPTFPGDISTSTQDPFRDPIGAPAIFDNRSTNSVLSNPAVIPTLPGSPSVTIGSSIRSHYVHPFTSAQPTISGRSQTTNNESNIVSGTAGSQQSNNTERLSQSDSIAGSDLSFEQDEEFPALRLNQYEVQPFAFHRSRISDPFNDDNNGRLFAKHTLLRQLALPNPEEPVEAGVHRPIDSSPRHLALQTMLPGTPTGSTSLPATTSTPSISFTPDQPDLRENIRREIIFFLQDADLGSITRGQVREHLFVEFGDALNRSDLQDFINECIERFAATRLGIAK